jgi:Zn-dependent protease with chaperone function
MSAAAILAPLLASACLGLAGPRAARRLPPRHATWLISVGAVVTALSSAAVLGLLGFVLLGQLPDLAGIGHWSAETLRRHSPAEPGVGALSLAGSLTAAIAVCVAGARQAIALRASYRACRAMPTDQDMVVVDSSEPAAVAVPGRPGRIVVSRSLLRLLSPAERRVLLAHERAHLGAGHHWHRSAVALAAAANPLLRPLRGAIAFSTERWADERAAAELGDRRGAARALARVALLGGKAAQEAPGLAVGGQAVAARVSALFADPPRPRPAFSLAMIALLVLALGAALVVESEIESLFDLAVHAYRVTGGT